jgi:hypothetical protein
MQVEVSDNMPVIQRVFLIRFNVCNVDYVCSSRPRALPSIFMFTTGLGTPDNRKAVASPVWRNNRARAFEGTREGTVPCLMRMEFSGSVGQEDKTTAIC